MDFIITVCDNAAGEVCPVWPSQPTSAHWGFEDPAAVEGTDEQKRDSFKQIFNQIYNRIRVFAALPLASLDKMAIKHEMDKIGSTKP